MVDECLLRKRRDDQCRNAVPGSPRTAGRRWRNVIPESSVLVVGHDDERVGPFAAVLDGVDDARDMLHALEQAGVAGMLVGCADWLDEANPRQLARGKVGEEPILVL